MALIGEFDLKYYNKNLYKDVSLNDFPSLIKELTLGKVHAKEVFDNKGKTFESRDHWADAKAYFNQSCEKLNIAKNTYTEQITSTIHNLEEIIQKQPEFKGVLDKALQEFKTLLACI